MKSTIPKPFVFVLMPFAPEFDDVYKLGIKPACENAGAYAERLDEQIFTENMLDRIYNQISKADVIVAEMTGRNPNVFYETGYAHALGKKVILVTKTSDDIPFDLKHYPHIVYEGRISDLLDELSKKIAWIIAEPQRDFVENDVQLFIEGHLLPSEVPIELRSSYVGVPVKIDVHNPINRKMRPIKVKLGLIIPNDSKWLFSDSQDNMNISYIKQPDGSRLYIHRDQQEYLSPGSWVSFIFWIMPDGRTLGVGDVFSGTLRAFYESGIKDQPFSIIDLGSW